MAVIALATVFFWACPLCDHHVKAFETGGIFPNAMRHMSDAHPGEPWDAATKRIPSPPERRIWAFTVRPDT